MLAMFFKAVLKGRGGKVKFYLWLYLELRKGGPWAWGMAGLGSLLGIELLLQALTVY